MKINVFWFRRDLRLEDNTALNAALSAGLPVLPIFIFDRNILNELPKNDARVGFIYDTLININEQLKTYQSSVLVIHDTPQGAWENLLETYHIENVFVNRDYEPYGTERDANIKSLLDSKGIGFHSFKDHVIFEPGEVLKSDGTPYTVYTPFKNAWLKRFDSISINTFDHPPLKTLHAFQHPFPTLASIGFEKSNIKTIEFNLSSLNEYGQKRDFPSENVSSYLGPHLRFGTVSIRAIVNKTAGTDAIFLSELIWREFFIQILFHFPHVVNQNFKPKYNGIEWRNKQEEFQQWCNGKTGYPIVDAGMRQLNTTGYMHNRVRMITASFLCKHLLIDWRWGEAYFAQKLLDFELASNNGNWQWVAGTGCDAAPYFRVFNPTEQTKKFDQKLTYIQRWVPELNEMHYQPMVDHKMARNRALDTYKKGLEN